MLVIAFVNLEHKKIHQTKQISFAGNTLFTLQLRQTRAKLYGLLKVRKERTKKPYPEGGNAEKCIVEGRWKSQLLLNAFLSLLHRSLFIVIGSLTTTMIPTVCHQKTTSGQCCIIPFTYKGVTYNSCTDADHHRLWCSLDRQYKGRWENCCKFLINWPD